MKPTATDIDESPRDDTLYESDFFAWTEQTAALLRAGRLAEVDVENVAEEIESLGKRIRNEPNSRMQVLLLHLLKWMAQPTHRSSSWETTILTRREEIADLLGQSPSLRPTLPAGMARNYARAVRHARIETGLDAALFPPQCPVTLEQILDDAFLPS